MEKKPEIRGSLGRRAARFFSRSLWVRGGLPVAVFTAALYYVRETGGVRDGLMVFSSDLSARHAGKILRECEWTELLMLQHLERGRWGSGLRRLFAKSFSEPWVFEIDDSFNAGTLYDLCSGIASGGVVSWEIRDPAGHCARFATVDSPAFASLRAVSSSDWKKIWSSPMGAKFEAAELGTSCDIFKVGLSADGDPKEDLARVGVGEGVVLLFVDPAVRSDRVLEIYRGIEALSGRPPMFVLEGKDADFGVDLSTDP